MISLDKPDPFKIVKKMRKMGIKRLKTADFEIELGDGVGVLDQSENDRAAGLPTVPDSEEINDEDLLFAAGISDDMLRADEDQV